MSSKKQELKVQIRLTGKTGEIDGIMEIVVGMFMMTNILLSVDKSVTDNDRGTSKIYLDFILRPPPLGNQGEGDLPPYTGDNP